MKSGTQYMPHDNLMLMNSTRPTRKCLILVYGLPGSGKSSFCSNIVASFPFRKSELKRQQYAEAVIEPLNTPNGIASSAFKKGAIVERIEAWSKFNVQVHYLNFDQFEDVADPHKKFHVISKDLERHGVFDHENWKLSRKRAYSETEQILREWNHEDKQHYVTTEDVRYMLLVDDTFHLRSMRKRFYFLARKYDFAYHQILIDAPLDVCLKRISLRPIEKQIPAAVMHQNSQSLKENESGSEVALVFPEVTSILEQKYALSKKMKHWENDTGVTSWKIPYGAALADMVQSFLFAFLPENNEIWRASDCPKEGFQDNMPMTSSTEKPGTPSVDYISKFEVKMRRLIHSFQSSMEGPLYDTPAKLSLFYKKFANLKKDMVQEYKRLAKQIVGKDASTDYLRVAEDSPLRSMERVKDELTKLEERLLNNSRRELQAIILSGSSPSGTAP